MTLLSKISKTKKRSFDNNWFLTCGALALVGLLAILVFCFRVPSMAWTYGIVNSQFPVMSVPLKDDSYNRISYSNQKKIGINSSTPTVVITRENFYFGNLDAFTDKFADVRNKFYISHIDGEPQVAELISTMTRWHKQKLKRAQKFNTDVLVLLPSSEIPISIVTQVMYWMKKSELYENVILASELL